MSADVTVANARTRIEVGQSLLQAISRGETWSPAYHAAWLQKRAPRILSIDAIELLELLIAATSESGGGIPRGLSAEGLRVNGLLDLRRLNFPKSIMLRDCRLNDGIAIDDARLGPLDLSGSDFPRLSAEGVHVDGDLILDRLEQTDWIDLRLARIAGQLNLADRISIPERSICGREAFTRHSEAGSIRRSIVTMPRSRAVSGCRTASAPTVKSAFSVQQSVRG